MPLSKPTDLPDWATDVNYPAGSDPWSGQPTKVMPSAPAVAEGFVPKQRPTAQETNWILGTHGLWIEYHDDRIENTNIKAHAFVAYTTSTPVLHNAFNITTAAEASLGAVEITLGEDPPDTFFTVMALPNGTVLTGGPILNCTLMQTTAPHFTILVKDLSNSAVRGNFMLHVRW